jgi:transposase-like protein
MELPVQVFSEEEARVKRGENATEMIVCPACGEPVGVLINSISKMEYHGKNREDVSFDFLVWERWQCLSCRNVWIERYGVVREQEDKVTVQEDSLPAPRSERERILQLAGVKY